MGRFYVFRDSPDYVVKIFADFDLDKSTDSMAKLIMQAREELTLRDRRAAA